MPNKNDRMNMARAEYSEDEFYTQLVDIENELQHYKKDQFEGRVVYCNCDDPLESNFFIYFVKNFKALGLKKLITTCYDGSPIAGTQLLLDFEETRKNPRRVAYKIEVTDVSDFSRTDKEINFWDVADALRKGTKKAQLEKLKGSGDFQSEECVKLLQESDIVITNPPFSLFGKHFAQVAKYNKKFLVIGRQIAAAYEDVFPLVKADKAWAGVGFKGGATHFYSPYLDVATSGHHKKGMIRVSGVVWFTNMEHDMRPKPLDLTAEYTPQKYPKYEGMDAIHVESVADIPRDYDGVMGVPTSFFEKYCPEQFEIVGCSYAFGRPDFWPEDTKMTAKVNGEDKFKRLFIRRRKSS